MIRVVQKTDITKVADIWLDTNIKAHNFISAQYWESNYELVKEMLLQAEVYVCESNGEIQGFIGLNGDYIEGIFVCDRLQSQGIGKLLLDFVKESRTQLSLNVYQKNTRAIHFYQREGFEIQNEGLDEATGENVKKLILKESDKKYRNWEIFEIDKLLVEGKNTAIEGWNKKHLFLGKIYTVSGSKAVKRAKKNKLTYKVFDNN